MDILREILHDWLSCSPDGASLPSNHISRVLERVRSRILAAEGAGWNTKEARALLEIRGTGLPPFLQLLRFGGVIHFVHFWQACQELWRRLGQVEDLDRDEPVSAEITEFRDALLRRLGSGGIAGRALQKEIQAAQDGSTDKAAWAPLLRAQVGEHDQQQLLLHSSEVSALLLPWLRNLSKDYLEGARSRDIWGLRDVTGCKMREACLHLGGSNWDIEAALRSYYGGGSSKLPAAPRGGDRHGFCSGELTATGSSWSSRGAKMRREETECPICMEAFKDGDERVEFKCCFQIMCRSCRNQLVKDDRINCPFCRTVTAVPSEEEEERQKPPPPAASRRRARSASLERVCRAAGRLFEDLLGEPAPRQVLIPVQARPPRPPRSDRHRSGGA
jgi:hypothetical protein